MNNFFQTLSAFFRKLFGGAPNTLALAAPLQDRLNAATELTVGEPDIPVPHGPPPTLGLRVSEFVATSVWD
jgi:hypothetical protein